MKYTPDAILTADLALARKHSVGAEKTLFANDNPMLDIGAVQMAGDGSGIWTPDTINLTGVTGYTDLAAPGDPDRARAQDAISITQPVILRQPPLDHVASLPLEAMGRSVRPVAASSWCSGA